MSRFVDPNKLVQIDLGDGDWVKVPERLSYGMISSIGNVDKNNAESTTKLLTLVIKEWNLKDDEGELVTISKENILTLDVQTVTVIATEVAEMMNIDKKKLAA